jgi:hypothetical protein
LGLLGWPLILTWPSYAEESANFEKLRDISPDGRFAVRISCSSEPENPNDIDSNLITAVELVSLPSKNVVMKVGQPYVSTPHLIWSKDSNWFAFPLSSGSRMTDTYVYHRSGDDFTRLETEELQVDVKCDVRNQYVQPIRWIKPGVLLLEQFVIFRGGDGKDAADQFTAQFDEKTGKFHIISKKKVPSKE